MEIVRELQQLWLRPPVRCNSVSQSAFVCPVSGAVGRCDPAHLAGKAMMLNDASLEEVDPEIAQLIGQEKHRQVGALSAWSCRVHSCSTDAMALAN